MKLQKRILRPWPLLLLLIWAMATTGGAQDFNVRDFGAVNDTTINSTQAFQQAIDACAASGGGRVLIPSGQFKIGSIFLKSHVELHLSHGAYVFGSPYLEDYTPVKPDYASLRTQEETIQLIYAEKCTNVAITGTGTIDGQGKGFKKESWSDEGITRPHLLRFIACEKVRVENVSLRNAACWMQHFLACTDVYIRGINVYNHANFNNDGIDIDGCKNVVIADVIVDSDDDGIVLKSTSGRGCENVTISNAIISSHCNALKLGTESNTGFRNIAISNCVVKPSAVDTSKFFGLLQGISGLSLEMVDGGELTGVTVSNIRIAGTEVPLFIRLGARNRPFKKGQVITAKGRLHDINIYNVSVSGAGKTGCSITGMSDSPVRNIRLSNISIEFAGGGSRKDPGAELPLADYRSTYPEATMFGVLPAAAFYIRHAEDVSMDNIKVEFVSDEGRPAFHLEEVNRARLSDFVFSVHGPMRAAFKLKNAQYIQIKNCRLFGALPHFLTVEGTANQKLQLLNNDFSNCTDKPILAKDAAYEQILKKGNINNNR